MTLPTVTRTNQLDVLEEIRDKVNSENTASTNTSTALGMPGDAVATTDTGSFSLLALVKRSLSNWTTLLSRIPVQIISGLLPVDSLATLGAAKTVAGGAASAEVVLTATCRRVSIHCRDADARFVIGSGAQVATATSHFIGISERLDFNVPANSRVAAIRNGSVNATLEITELV